MQIDLRERASPESVCAYCKDAVAETDPRVSCIGCQVVMHADCRRELARCPTPGCGQGSELRVEPRRSPTRRCRRCDEDIDPQDGLLDCTDCDCFYHWECWQESGQACLTPGCTGRARAPGAAPSNEEREPWTPRSGSAAPRERTLPGITQPGWLEVPAFTRAGQLLSYGLVAGFGLGLVGGFLYGGVMVPRHGFDFVGGLKWSLVAFPLALAAALYGALQGLIGIRSPQLKGGGLGTMFLVMGAYFVTLTNTDHYAAAGAAAVVTSLICGRLFGFNFPDKN